MKPLYRYAVDDAVLGVFAEAKKRHREELLRIFARLATDPFIEGDSTQRDATGRHCQVKRFGALVGDVLAGTSRQSGSHY